MPPLPAVPAALSFPVQFLSHCSRREPHPQPGRTRSERKYLDLFTMSAYNINVLVGKSGPGS